MPENKKTDGENLTPAQKRLRTIQERQANAAEGLANQEGQPTDALKQAQGNTQEAEEQLAQARQGMADSADQVNTQNMTEEEKQLQAQANQVTEANAKLLEARAQERLAGTEETESQPSTLSQMALDAQALLMAAQTGRELGTMPAPQRPTRADAIVASAAESDISGGVAYGNLPGNPEAAKFEQTKFVVMGKTLDPNGNETE